jgi:hypothetical protein
MTGKAFLRHPAPMVRCTKCPQLTEDGRYPGGTCFECRRKDIAAAYYQRKKDREIFRKVE